VVAKGVSPPSLGLWLLICLFRNKSAAHLAALLAFLVQLSYSSHLSAVRLSTRQGQPWTNSARFFGLRLSARRISLLPQHLSKS
jgi:hypothetical protein